MYDPHVVDVFVEVYRTIEVSAPDKADRVMQAIAQSKKDAPLAVREACVGAHAGDDVLTFVSLARLAAGSGTLGDMLSLSTKLVRDLTPGVSGAWYIVGDDAGQLTAVETFGPSAGALRGRTMRLGDRLTGWVGASRQPIRNSDAALDLGNDVPALKSCLSVPLIAGSSLAGVLTLYAERRDAFSESQGRLVQMVAPHIATGIDLARRRPEQPNIQIPRELKLVVSH
jgi:GAF domain-containing protein